MNAPVAQLGFDFASNSSQSYGLALGAWNDPEWTVQDWTRALELATRRVASVDDRLLTIYRAGIDASRDELAAWVGHGADIEMRMRRQKVESEESANLETFFRTCEQLNCVPVAGIEVKSRKDGHVTTSAVFVEGVGTLIARHWEQTDSGHIAYEPWKDHFFLPSYHDDMPSLRVPVTTWRRAYCADKIAMSGAGVASVPTFKLRGREYVQVGSMGFGEMEYGRAWCICPISDWTGDTYSYRTICKAWDDGVLERGDERGLVVKVRGQLCVFESALEIYDERPRDVDSIAQLLADRADDEQDEEMEGDVECDDALEALDAYTA
ncbi:hypothetical protein ACT2FY_39075 [Paraburkholderia fungorum]|uniref:hypothetical protein n=1 Tax=Paraburkholderia fungorum TaxID=134537 RepID=UPI00402BB4D7